MIQDFPMLELIDVKSVNLVNYTAHLADCVILTHDNKLALQQRPLNWGKSAGNLNIFGGHVEHGETIMQGLTRELHEELGAIVKVEDVIFIGAITEDFTNHTEIVHVHFWHDKDNTITGCFEAEIAYYDRAAGALAHPKIMDYTKWALLECQRRGLII